MAVSITLGTAATAAMPWLKDIFNKWLEGRKAANISQRTWTETCNAVVRHTKTLAQRFSEISTVAFPQESTSLESIYVPLKLVAKNTKVGFEINSYPGNLIKRGRKILVVDSAGMGKSTISKVIFLHALAEAKALPIFIDLRRLTRDVSIDSILSVQFGLKAKHEDPFFDFLRSQPILFLLDGFDEIPEDDKIHVARTLRDFIDQNEKATFFITSRPEVFFSSFTDFKTYAIAPLSKPEAHELIRKYGIAYEIESRAKALIQELKAKHDPAVSSFLKNPLLTSLLFRAFEYKSVVPVKRGVFYRQVFDALFDAHDLNKETGFVRGKRTGLHQDDFHRAMRSLASLFRKQRVTEVTQDQFKAMARKLTESLCSDLSFSSEDLLHDCTSAVPLFSRDGNHIRWSHKSLLDYFLCEFLIHDYTESKADAISKVALGIGGIVDQNFLTLVQEADPTLFAEAVTIPASVACLARYNEMKRRLSKLYAPSEIEDLAQLYMAYEFGFIKALPTKANDLATLLDEDADKDQPKYVLRGIMPVGRAFMYLFEHVSHSALNVPMRSGALQAIKRHQVTKLKTTEGKEVLYSPDLGLPVFATAIDRGELREIDNDVSVLASKMPAELLITPDASELRANLERLQAVVASSKRARSNDIF